jgi:hypothetical protein
MESDHPVFVGYFLLHFGSSYREFVALFFLLQVLPVVALLAFTAVLQGFD